jgi:putative salt-induced outer membrane protein YdiY
MTLPMDSVTQVNPLVHPQIIYTGNLNAGYSQAIGNSHLRSISLVGDLVARSEQRRQTILADTSMATMPAASSLAMLGEPFKSDHFITKRFFWYGSVYLENDRFQGIKLRASISSGPGYHALLQSAAHRQDKTDNLDLTIDRVWARTEPRSHEEGHYVERI